MEQHPIYDFARHYNPNLTDAEIKSKFIDGGKYLETLDRMRQETYPDLDQDAFLTKFHTKYPDLSKKKEPTVSGVSSSAGSSYSWESGRPELAAKISTPNTSLTSGSSGKITPEAAAASKRASQELALQKARQRPNFEKPADLDEYTKQQVQGSVLAPEKEYRTRLNTLQSDSDNLQRAIEASEARIKEKWGDNWMADYNARVQALNNPETRTEELAKKQQEFEADQFINERNNFITALEANQESGKEILKDDKYAYARALEEYDKKKLQKAEHAGWGNLTLGILQRSAGKLVGSVGEVMNIGENLTTGDKKYNAWDKIEDFFIDFQDQTAKVAPRPTKYTRPLYTKTAKATLNGEKVEVDFDGDKPSVVRDSKGMVIDADPTKLGELKPKNQYNSKGLIYQTGEVLADAMVQIATTKGIGGTLVKTGMGAKTAYATGVTASTMGQMAGGLYDQGLKMFDGDKRKAAQYAAMTGLAIGVGSNLFGVEARLAGGPGVFDNLTMGQVVKGLTPKAAAARTATNFFKEGGGEMIEETIVEKAIEGATAMVLNGDAEDIDLNEIKGTALISFAVGALMGVGDSDFKNSAWLVAAENPEEFKKALQAEKENGKNIDVEKMYNKALKIKGLSEIKEVREEDIPKLDELTELKDKAEKAKAIGADAQAKVFKEQAEAKELDVFKEKDEEEISDEVAVAEMPLETPQEIPIQESVNQEVVNEPQVTTDLPSETPARQTFESSIDQSIADLDITQEQADALKQTTSANAQNWAKRTGRTEEEFYEKFKPTVSRNTEGIPGDALKQIVGEKANVPEARKNLQIAKRAEGKMTPKAIYLATGWEKVDGKWKYDLPDVEVGTLEGTNKLGDVAKGGILDAYPDAKDIEVTVDPNLKTLGVRQGNKISIRDGADKSTLIHELQHWVQQKEGFAGGASLDRVSDGMFSKLQAAKTKFLESNPNLAKALKGENVELSEEDVTKLVESKQLLQEYSETVTDIFNKYRSVVGEVEARNAEARAKMSPAERKLTPISETEDTKDKIYLQEKEGEVLGAFSTIDGEASAWLFDGATVETLFHEIDPTTGHFGHAVMYDILDNALPEYRAQAEADVKAIEEFLGASDRNWTREQHEQFVAAGEKYLREGVAPTPELRPVFERLKQWLTDIFNSIKDRTDIDITPEVRQVFARMMGREEMLPLIEEVNRSVDQPGFASGFIGEKVWGVMAKSGAMSWLKKAWKYTFFGRGDLPLDVAQLNYRRIARIEGMMKQAELTANKLKKLIKGKTPQQIEDLNYALQSTATTYSDGRPIEPEVLDLIGKMREHVTSMSSELINTGIADGKLAAIISKNLDTYLTRSYQIHFNKNWVKTVKDTAAYTRAKAFLEKKFAQEEADAQAKIAKYQAKLANNPEYWGKRIKNQEKRIGRDVEAELDAILEKQAKGLSLGDVAKSGSLGSMNLGVFKKRKEIAEEIRDVFGEVKDPIVNYMTSIFKTAHILENNKFLSKVEDEGKDKFLFERPTGPYTAQFPDTPQMGPLAGYYSTPEIVEAFRLYNKPIGDMTEEGDVMGLVYKSILGITSRAKSFMTIFSIASASRNFTSNLLLQAQKGLFNVADPNIKKAFKLFGSGNETELVEMYSLGVLGDGITFGEIADVRKQYSKKFAGADNTTQGKVNEKLGAVTKFMSHIYQFGDEFYRAIDYYRNLDKMARLYKGAEYDSLSPDVQQEVKLLAAERVSSENPTYSRLPRNIKALRRNPFVAPFPSFPYEMVRVSYNIMANLIQDMKMGQDTTVKVAGVDMSYKNLMLGKVMAGTMAVSIAPFLLKELITNMLGWSDDDDEKLKYFVPFYHEGSLLIPSPWNDQKGSVDYYDWGYMFPQGHILSTVSTVSDERFSPAENVGRAAEKFFEPFYSIDPLMKSLIEATYGQQLGKTGRPISQVGESGWLKARVEHVGKKLTPGTIKSFERVFRSFNEPETDYYGKLNPIQEGVAIFPGFRSYNVDIHRSFGFLGRNMADKINDSKADYGVEKNKEQIKALPEKEREAHLSKVKEREMRDYSKFVMDFHEIYMAAIDFPGVDKKKIDESLKDLRLDKITIRGIMTGEVGEPEFFRK